MASLSGRKIAAVLLDVTGVLYESGPHDGKVIEGSPEAVQKLRQAGCKIKFCTNETTITRKAISERLIRHGFSLTESEIHSPSPACRAYLAENNLRPYLIVHPNAMADYQGVDQSDPNCVVLGDATDSFTYQRLNQAFRMLISQQEKAEREKTGRGTLISLGKGRYYRDNDKLTLDVGPYTAALEYAAGISAVVIGKPARTFFTSALQDLQETPENAVMIGDDLISDVGGAQGCGLAGILVRTGKYRPGDEQHPTIKPDRIADNLAQAVNSLLS